MISYIRDIVRKGLGAMAHSAQTEISRRIAYEVRRAQRRLIKSMISFFFIALSLVLLAIGGVYLGIEYLAFSKTLAFLTVGVILLLIGIIIKITD